MSSQNYNEWLKENVGMKFMTVFGIGFLMGLAAAGSQFTVKLDGTGAVIHINAEDMKMRQQRPNGPGQWVPVDPPRPFQR
ncbi:hypothetical protein BDZ97DRAFT_1918074 [Flammula alnicola]|nr:hypothetical protein BDZ97DRAFT_1918074 [Flammula alnicola]